MLKFKIAEKLGGLTAIISDNLKDVEIEGVGKGRISWANMRPEYPCINYIEPYKEVEQKLFKIAEEKGIRPKDKRRIKITLTEEQKEILYKELRQKHQQFFDDLMTGKIKVKLCWLSSGCVLDVEEQSQYGIETWDLMYHYLEEKYHLYNATFIPLEKRDHGLDVTDLVITKIKEIDAKRKIEAEEREKERIEREKEKATMSVKILKQGKMQGEGLDPYVIVEITDVATNKKAQFVCRNIFDFGYVINPNYAVAEGLEPGGIAIKKEDVWYWQEFNKGWHNVRPLTEFEVKAIQYLHKFPPISKEIRM